LNYRQNFVIDSKLCVLDKTQISYSQKIRCAS